MKIDLEEINLNTSCIFEKSLNDLITNPKITIHISGITSCASGFNGLEISQHYGKRTKEFYKKIGKLFSMV